MQRLDPSSDTIRPSITITMNMRDRIKRRNVNVSEYIRRAIVAALTRDEAKKAVNKP